MSKCKSIFIIGIDGSGKTSHVSKLETNLASLRYKVKKVWIRGRGRVFLAIPLLAIARLTGLTIRVKTPSGVMASVYHFYKSSVMSGLWSIVELLDTTIFSSLFIHLPILRGNLVLGDRCPIDTFVDTMTDIRKEHGFENHLNLYLKTLPSDFVVILLDVDPIVASRRKLDIPDTQVIKLKRELYLKIAKRYGWPIVDSSKSFTETHNKILSYVKDFVGTQ